MNSQVKWEWSVEQLRRPLLPAALIVIFSLLAYANTFHVPFYLDDVNTILENSLIHDLGRFLGPEGYHHNPRRFIGYLTFALNYQWGGAAVAGYHAVNLGIHTLAALLVYALVRTTFRTPLLREGAQVRRGPFIALATALLFALHPVNTQAVTYIVQRFASLASLFFLLAVTLYARGRLVQSDHYEMQRADFTNRWEGRFPNVTPALCIAYYFGALLCALLAMGTKEIAFTLPIVLLLYEVSFFRTTPRRRTIFLVAALGSVVLAGLLLAGLGLSPTELLHNADRLLRENDNISRKHYLFTQLPVLVTYLQLLVLPVGQNMDYDHPVYTSFFTPAVLFAFLLLAGLMVFAFWCYRVTRHSSPVTELRLIGFGILWFFCTLAVESSLIPIADVMVEHRLYLPSAGIFLALSVLAGSLADRVSARTAAAGSMAVLVLLGTATFERNRLWGDPEAMWRDVVRKSPGNERGYCNLGVALIEKNRLEEAISALSEAKRLNPDYGKTFLNLGVAFGRKGQWKRAVANLERAVALDPAMWMAHANLGVIYGRLGLLGKSAGHLEEALRLNPGDAPSRASLARINALRAGLVN